MFLIVEDDKQIRNFINFSLKSQNYDCMEASTGKEAMNIIATQNISMIILDLGLPDMDGIDIIKTVRGFSDIPIIVVSSRDQDNEKVEALDAGADDYLTKPFSIKEFLARIRVVFRHKGNSKTEVSKIYKVADLEIDLEKHIVLLEGKEVHFTPMEYNVLTLLVKNAGKVLTHNYILKEVWGSYIESDMQSLRVFMANIRRKLEKSPAKPRYILTEVGIGYRFADE
ncbi:response regulator [Sedimentibacter saalensis]|jgi:two-component system KDP operon response regulator KdpE|uniref:Two-component system KDP operon response regulator KdpE n=2 Tax=root TaxID=1 RepID=A0A562JK82_9FIRM|nr:response regulator transcription factor [Sedimentibacter saalensis]MEA5095640.1 response regulator transcription factor [Sedimentibacter saalensis]TWH83579.1 two-component system KDP operon response regulator KdpE [Sedimentibacter saalensis]